MAYLLTRKNGDKELFSSTTLPLEGYKFNPSKKTKEIVHVSRIVVVDRRLINVILNAKFEKKFRDLIKLANAIINDDDTSSEDTQIGLDEVELIREILLNRYQKFISQQKEELFLKKLRIIENELRYKQVLINQYLMYQDYYQEESQRKGR